MIAFIELREKLELELKNDIIDILNSVGISELEINCNSGYISGTFDTKAKVQAAVDLIPDDIDYEIDVISNPDDDSKDGDELFDTIDEIDFDALDDSIHVYEIYVYIDNTDAIDGGVYEGRKRIIKINFKGHRRIKIKCAKGFKYDGKRCVKIGGTEKLMKRKAIKKAVRTKRAKGAGAQRKTTRLRLKAMKKRKSMGLSRRK